MPVIDLGGEVHYVDHGGEGPVMVLVHGLGGSHLNWTEVAPTLARRFTLQSILIREPVVSDHYLLAYRIELAQQPALLTQGR